MKNKGDNVIILMPKPDGIPVLPYTQQNFFLDFLAMGIDLQNTFFVPRGKVARMKKVSKDELIVNVAKLDQA